MLTQSDLDSAVQEGIITSDQAKRLSQHRHEHSGERDVFAPSDQRDEPFHLLRGFRDVFIALGLLLLGISAGAFITHAANPFILNNISVTTNFSGSSWWTTVFLLVIAFSLAELITRKLRLPLSSLVLVLFIAYFGGKSGTFAYFSFGINEWITKASATDRIIYEVLFGGAFAVVMIGLFYWRHRLPFALLPLALAFVTIIGAICFWLFGDLFSLENNLELRIIIGLLGICVFLVAMIYDGKDPNRVHRFSECGFWLHLIAAPMIVHSALASGGQDGLPVGVVFVVFGVLALFALVIDRRALLISGLVYLFYALYGLVGSNSSLPFLIPLMILGITVVLLGLGWTPLRRFVVGLMPSFVRTYVPPLYHSTSAVPSA